ncbi:hypothetical protein GPECTOR_330g54 [Gonium pectorale]|uniref:BACK domain-containing protein n=1 Tax=Gonium pectorale TaxID=33097 RepID=A0A150FVN4_GONPE|nr:hypothetical protein GPECTOR_330g54 [Gonium pectorale]|eukprot:KXZ41669.1 hypothetical protein GPECTOR_330g54 [Gonium pectorale]
MVQVERGSTVRELLQLYRQGGYLQVEGCAEVCLAAISDKLAGPSTAGTGGSGSSGGSGSNMGGGGGGPDSRICPEVLELYDCIGLWPDPATEPAFAVITAKARERLVLHFGDALTTLNTPELRRQLLALPVEALEVLLEADEFDTDVEDTILLMLATWVQENGGAAVPAAPKRQRLLEQAPGKRNLQATWFSTRPRRPCLLAATSGGNGTLPSGSSGQQQMRRPTFEWSISQEELERGLRGLQPGGAMHLECTLANGLNGISARGFEWRASINYKHGAEAAGLFLRCHLPAAYRLDTAALGSPLAALAQVGARVEADRWRNGAREVTRDYAYVVSDFIGVGTGRGVPSALPLKRGGEGTAGGGGGRGGSQRGSLRAWSEYIHGGKITGRLVLLPLAGR